MDLSIFSKHELNFINLHIGLVIKDIKELEECVEKYWNDLNITFWDTTNITNMNNIFVYKTKFNELLLWNVSNVTNMNCMFYGCKIYKKPLNNWIVDNVTTMYCMFKKCKKKIEYINIYIFFFIFQNIFFNKIWIFLYFQNMN